MSISLRFFLADRAVSREDCKRTERCKNQRIDELSELLRRALRTVLLLAIIQYKSAFLVDVCNCIHGFGSN